MTTNLIDFPKPETEATKPLFDMGVLISTWLGLYAVNSQMRGRDYADDFLKSEIVTAAQTLMKRSG